MVSKAVIDTLIAEAGGEGEEGLIAAAWAIQQRAAARGVSIDRVVKSGFDGYTNPGSGSKAAQSDAGLRRRVEQIMTGVEAGTIPNPVPGADHFLSGDVMPTWAKGMKLVATIGGHRFYASGKVPDSAQGGSVATQLDTARAAPTPAKPSAAMTVARNRQAMTPAADIGLADKTAITPGLKKDGSGITDIGEIVFGKEMTTRLAQPANAALAGARPAVTPPSTRAADVATMRNANQAAADAERNRTVVAVIPSRPAVSASDKARGKSGAPSPIGKPPATRVVQSVPVKGRPTDPAAAATKPTAKLDEIGAMPAFGDVTMLANSTVPGPVAADKAQARLLPQPPLIDPGAALGSRLNAPVPGVQSAAMIAARLPRKVAPVPAARPAAVATMRSTVPVIARAPVVARAPAPIASPAAFNPANHIQAQIEAVSSGRSSYVGPDGGVRPTYSISGGLRNTYGEL